MWERPFISLYVHGFYFSKIDVRSEEMEEFGERHAVDGGRQRFYPEIFCFMAIAVNRTVFPLNRIGMALQGRTFLFTMARSSSIMAIMRIFTGIALDDEVRKNALEELQPFRKAGIPMRWTDELNLHLTLKFIGEVTETVVACLGAVLEALPPASPFRLRLRGFGKFPAGDEMHVLWVGVEESPELRALFAAVEDALAALGIHRDTRPFHPHVTLGRSQARFSRGASANHDFKGLISLLQTKNDVFLGEWQVSAWRLYSSCLNPGDPEGRTAPRRRGRTAPLRRGPRRGRPCYTVLKEMPLVES